MDAVILPMTVATYDRQTTDLMLPQPGKERIGLVAEAAKIGMIVDLLQIVRSHHRRR